MGSESFSRPVGRVRRRLGIDRMARASKRRCPAMGSESFSGSIRLNGWAAADGAVAGFGSDGVPSGPSPARSAFATRRTGPPGPASAIPNRTPRGAIRRRGRLSGRAPGGGKDTGSGTFFPATVHNKAPEPRPVPFARPESATPGGVGRAAAQATAVAAAFGSVPAAGAGRASTEAEPFRTVRETGSGVARRSWAWPRFRSAVPIPIAPAGPPGGAAAHPSRPAVAAWRSWERSSMGREGGGGRWRASTCPGAGSPSWRRSSARRVGAIPAPSASARPPGVGRGRCPRSRG